MNTVAQRTARKLLATLVAGLVMGSALVAMSTSSSQAAGWGTISDRSVNKVLSSRSWTTLRPAFSTAANVRYRYCVTLRGRGTVNLQPQAFSTETSVNNSSYVTRCTKSYRGPANRFTPTAARIGDGAVRVGRIKVQRWYAGSVPG
ncbi:hypothetical protein [Nocardioides sp. NPDC004968]|uniref:hypothetical protein n=1 Tax=Nocardioides sp. NPDC004968 TaxID=3155894 RepID=UPI00339F3A0A